MDFILKQHIETCLNKKFRTNHHFYWQSVGGGSINNTYKLSAKNISFFVKTNTKTVFENGFKEEVLGLQFLQKNTALIPEIILEGSFENSIYLVLSWIEVSEQTPLFWKNFSEQLANLHQHENDVFGLNHSNYMGELLQLNSSYNNFSDFFIENRLKPQLQLAFDSGKIQQKHLLKFEGLFKEIPALFPLEKPSAIHGDLLSGNFIASIKNKAIFIDPAVYYGHREIDLAMTTLFGGFSTEFYEHYQEVYPLEKGFNNRKEFYNLYPLLIHLNLFGNSYLNSIESIITKF
jgi:fructosamine-3-kinase